MGTTIRNYVTASGHRFAYVGEFTLVFDGYAGTWGVARDIDGDEVVQAVGLTWDEAVKVAA